MLEHYLCPGHRDWLIRHSDAAVSCWHQSVDTGMNHHMRRALPQARSAFGCSLEIAEILLVHCKSPHQDAVARYTVSLLLFAGICRDTGYRSLLGELTNRGIQILRRSWNRAVIPTYLFHASWQVRQIAANPGQIERLLGKASIPAETVDPA